MTFYLGVKEAPHGIGLQPSAHYIRWHLTVVVVGARQADQKVLIRPVVADALNEGASRDRLGRRRGPDQLNRDTSHLRSRPAPLPLGLQPARPQGPMHEFAA